MINKEIFIRNLSQIAGGMKQIEIAKIMGCTAGTMSKYMNADKKDFPTAEMLSDLSKHFKVSIDWLIGNSDRRKMDSMSPRDICEMLVDIFTSSECSFKELIVTEDCFEQAWDSEEINLSSRENTYPVFYFSDWIQSDFEMERSDFATFGNHHRINPDLNKFIDRYLKIKSMLNEGHLETEMYEILLNNYLKDVPDK